MLVGPGRPDVASTTGGVITGSEPVGAVFHSTDGASVGAWAWQKTTAGWVVTVGDTGWLDLTASITFSDSVTRTGVVFIRRTPEHFMTRVINESGVNIPHQNVTVVSSTGWWSMTGGSRLHSILTGISGNLAFRGYVDPIGSALLIKADSGANADVVFAPSSTWPMTRPGTAA